MKKLKVETDPRLIAAMKQNMKSKTGTQTKPKLSIQREAFCQYYVSEDFFGDGVESYAMAYGIDLEKPGGRHTCRTSAYNLLTNTVILNRITEIQRHATLNNQFVDREMSFVIQQRADLGAKTRGIAEYNKVTKRIEERKIEVNFFTKLEELDDQANKSRKEELTSHHEEEKGGETI